MKTKFTLVLLTFALSVGKPNLTTAQVDVNDSLALVALYNSTDGPNWSNHDNWLTAAPVSSWYGISASSRVNQIDLTGNNLNGNIPPELGNLTNLDYLNFRINHLSGNIPPELAKLTNLIFLNLRNNQLTGSIPAELSSLTGLQYLFLFNNQLSGNIPQELGNLTHLIVLSSFNNQLSGSIPSSLSNLMNLDSLNLSGNQLSDSIPPELGNLKKLRYLLLDSNQLTGHIPSSFGHLNNLIDLNIKFNDLRGRMPSSLGNLSNLRHLTLTHNNLSGNIPSSFSKLKNLRKLRLRDNRLSGTVPAFLDSLPNLKELILLHNNYTFDGMETLVQNNTFDSFKYARQRAIDIHQNNNVLSVYAGGTINNNTYKWFKNGALVSTITGDSTFTPTSSGDYNVEVTNSVATELTLRSDTVSINAFEIVAQNNSDAVQANDKTNFSIYPNPAKATATISFNETGNCILRLTDVSGRVVQTKTIVGTKGRHTVQLDVSKYAKGVYLVTITNEKNERRTLQLNKE